MKTFFISQLTVLLLTFNGNIIGMHAVAKKLVSKNCRFYSIPLSLDNTTYIDYNRNNTSEIHNKDNENKQDHYVLKNTFNGKEEDKMAYYKRCGQKRS